MPFLMPKVMEFALVSCDGEPAALREDYGRFRLSGLDSANYEALKLEVLRCDSQAWAEPDKHDVAIFKRIVEKYGAQQEPT